MHDQGPGGCDGAGRTSKLATGSVRRGVRQSGKGTWSVTERNCHASFLVK